MAVLWLFFGWCVVVCAGIKAPVTSYVCSLYQINGVFSVSREVRVVFLLGCEPAFLRAS